MADDRVETFAKILVQQVRDETIQILDMRFDDRSDVGQHWRDVVSSMGPREAVLELMPEIVDRTIAELLTAIEEGDLHLFFAPEGGEPQDLRVLGRGEMVGNYADEEWWIARYSHERYHSYPLPDIPVPPPEDLRP